MCDFYPFLATLPNNRLFWASYVKFVLFFGVLRVHNFVVFMRKKSTKVQPPPTPHDRTLDPPLIGAYILSVFVQKNYVKCMVQKLPAKTLFAEFKYIDVVLENVFLRDSCRVSKLFHTENSVRSLHSRSG